jgi:hypothetical protein
MIEADRVFSTPPLSTPTDSPPPRLPTAQERADELLMRWRLERAAGLPPHLRLEDGACD